MPTKTRVTIVAVLILLGGALFYYCAVFYPIEITTQVKGDSAAVTGTESVLVNKTSTGCAEQDKSNQVNKTNSQSRPRPKTGAT